MANKSLYHHLYLLKKSSGKESRDILFKMKEMEVNEEISREDILELLQSANDPVSQNYAVGAIERLKIEEGYPLLKQLYLSSNNPLLLQLILETFLKLETSDFLDVVRKRLEKPLSKNKKKAADNLLLETLFDEDFITEQILIPSLKYFQVHGNPDLKKQVMPYLKHPDRKVRWNALVTLDKIGIKLENDFLLKLKMENNDVLIREQVNIILEKNSAKQK